eukprot:3937487-Rhodomonas_salina.3
MAARPLRNQRRFWYRLHWRGARLDLIWPCGEIGAVYGEALSSRVLLDPDMDHNTTQAAQTMAQRLKAGLVVSFPSPAKSNLNLRCYCTLCTAKPFVFAAGCTDSSTTAARY